MKKTLKWCKCINFDGLMLTLLIIGLKIEMTSLHSYYWLMHSGKVLITANNRLVNNQPLLH